MRLQQSIRELIDVRMGQQLLCMLAMLVVSLGWPDVASAHEAWVLTPEEMAEWNARPLPDLFIHLSWKNIALSLAGIGVVVAWLLVGRLRAVRQALPGVQAALDKLSPFSPFAVRIGLGVMLGMAAFGLSPRLGTHMFEAATLVAPDLELRRLPVSLDWLAWLEAYAAISLLLGVYVRLSALLVLALDLLGLALFGYDMWAYAGIVAAGPLYLLVTGAGRLALPLPSVLQATRLAASVMSPGLGLLLARLSMGLNFIYLGIEYKFRHANLSMAFIESEHVYTFGLEPATFVFCMFMVETAAGILMIAGSMLRLLSVVLMVAFIFMSYALHENPIGHIIVYGLLFAFFVQRDVWAGTAATAGQRQVAGMTAHQAV